MAINLPSISHRNYRLGLLEMVFRDTKISKFSSGTMPPEAEYQIPIWRGS